MPAPTAETADEATRPTPLPEVASLDDLALTSEARSGLEALPDSQPTDVLITGPSGSGTTTAARLLLDRWDVPVRERQSGERLNLAFVEGQLFDYMLHHPNGVVFLDDAHRLTYRAEQELAGLMEDHRTAVVLTALEDRGVATDVASRCQHVELSVPPLPQRAALLEELELEAPHERLLEHAAYYDEGNVVQMLREARSRGLRPYREDLPVSQDDLLTLQHAISLTHHPEKDFSYRALANAVGIAPATASDRIGRCEEAELVEDLEDRDGRYAARLRLTDRGRRYLYGPNATEEESEGSGTSARSGKRTA